MGRRDSPISAVPPPEKARLAPSPSKRRDIRPTENCGWIEPGCTRAWPISDATMAMDRTETSNPEVRSATTAWRRVVAFGRVTHTRPKKHDAARFFA